ncbi:TetR/AcrR family transcriptional regulator [Kribbella antibiotica]|uniref:TetR/AcrR family transcriptional regulator n=1 Tax=Kribbella antibiotica TaxID=190195 RepID=A0A4R4YZ96_9ACTN|nr:TetR/AcrR family transcriptional regulator [Kribbella antibiotica]TDD49974.1 TetR/AcrR family transcriptional regulator [Kribbella antibiotica]
MRRSPGPDERQRDAERTKQQLLDAAVTEFGAHGFSGARVSAIADRAGVNKQLISYYFGGKEGLYQAVVDRWRASEPSVTEPPGPLSDLVGAYAKSTIAQPDLLRLLIREGVDGDSASHDQEAQDERFQRMLADFTRRQSEGELPSDVDPAYAALALFGISAAPVVFPQIARALGLDPDNPDFGDLYAEQVGVLVSRFKSRR